MTKSFYNQAYKIGNSLFYDREDSKRIKKNFQIVNDFIKNTNFYKPDAKILEIGCGLANWPKLFPGYYGAEYSKSAVERVKQRDKNINIFETDAQDLCFVNEYFDRIFSFATLEHCPNPHKAFTEIDRVLKKGGSAMIAPAWHCRSWTVKKLEYQTYSEINFLEGIQKFFIPFREHILYRALIALPRRLVLELLSLFGKKEIPLFFKKLYPKWDLIEKYGHVADDDACASICIHSAIIFFKSRNYKILSHKSFLERIMSRHGPIIVKKYAS
jgi:ubiquinone/menaquinone biosynthesis C-methylase UbiE